MALNAIFWRFLPTHSSFTLLYVLLFVCLSLMRFPVSFLATFFRFLLYFWKLFRPLSQTWVETLPNCEFVSVLQKGALEHTGKTTTDCWHTEENTRNETCLHLLMNSLFIYRIWYTEFLFSCTDSLKLNSQWKCDIKCRPATDNLAQWLLNEAIWLIVRLVCPLLLFCFTLSRIRFSSLIMSSLSELFSSSCYMPNRNKHYWNFVNDWNWQLPFFSKLEDTIE